LIICRVRKKNGQKIKESELEKNIGGKCLKNMLINFAFRKTEK
jgi:hypothetical protein